MADHKTTCPQCGKVFKVKLEMQGKRCRCGKCQTRFVINIDTPFDQVLAPASPKVASQDVIEVQEQFESLLDSASAPPPAPAASAENEEVVEVVVTQPSNPSSPDSVHSSVMGGLLDQAAKSSGKSATRATGGSSAYQQLASKLVSAREESNQHAVYDPRKFMAYSTNANLVSRDSDIEKSARMVIRGGALILFAMMLVPLVLLGLHVSGSRWTCPVGGLLAAFLGGCGAVLVGIGLRSKIGKAALFGGVPLLGFLLVGGLVAFLSVNNYWGSGIQLFPNSAFRSGESNEPSRDNTRSPSRDPFFRDKLNSPPPSRDPFEGFGNTPDPFGGTNNNRGRDPFKEMDENRQRMKEFQDRMNRDLNNNFGPPAGAGRGGRRGNSPGFQP